MQVPDGMREFREVADSFRRYLKGELKGSGKGKTFRKLADGFGAACEVVAIVGEAEDLVLRRC